MLQNYLTIAVRNIVNHRLYSLINIGGLAIGLAACMLILMFIQDEMSYDKWIPNAERIYKFETTFTPPNRDPMHFAQSPGLLGESLQKDFTEIEQGLKIRTTSMPVRLGDKLFRERIAIADANFFDVFDYPVVAGLREEALQNNSSLLISEKIATKYFGTSNPLGQILNLDNEVDYKVVGVLKDLPENSNMRLDFLVWFDPARFVDQTWVTTCWYCANLHIYIKLTPGANIENIKADLPDFAQRNVINDGAGPDDRVWDGMQFYPRPILDIHLYSKLRGHFKQSGDIMAVITFSAVAILILIIAGINFMNLATARSMQRAREVSLRKVMGASKSQLVKQFLGEAIFTALTGLVLAILITKLSLPFFNAFLEKELVMNLFGDPVQGLSIIGFTLFVGILGGTYPAFFISSFRPSTVLRSNKSSQEGSSWLRNGLVILQFAISIILIVATSIIYGQTIYARNMDMGFATENRLTLYVGHPDATDKVMSLKQELLKLPGVKDAALSSDGFPKGNTNNSDVQAPGFDDSVLIERMVTGPNFFPLYDIKPLAGRLFDENRQGDYLVIPEDKTQQRTRGIVVNESFLKKTGFISPEDAIGKVVLTNHNQKSEAASTIVGVIPDLNIRSIYFAVTPMMYYPSKNPLDVMTLTLSPNDVPTTLAAIDALWTQMVPTVPVNRDFVDDEFDSFYNGAEQRAQMFAGFSIFAILVSCLGLYGLASFAAERRTKEIGVRKVMGAKVSDIIRLLVWQFSKPVLWSNIIAWGTVAHRAAKVARTNPINALKYE